MRTTLLTVEQVAERLHLRPSYVRRIWPGWVRWGVNPIRINGRGRRYLFKESDIEKLINQWGAMQ